MARSVTNTIGGALFRAWLAEGSPVIDGEVSTDIPSTIDDKQIYATRAGKRDAGRAMSPLHYGEDSAPLRAKHAAIGSARWRDKSSRGTELSIHSSRKRACDPSASGAHVWVVFSITQDMCRLCNRKVNRKPIVEYVL